MKIAFSIIIIITMSLSFEAISKANTQLLNEIIINHEHPLDYMATDEYLKNKEGIREELVLKLTSMIKSGNYDNFLTYLFFIVDIADPRYVPLLAKIEHNIQSIAGINIVGYSEFIELKNSKASTEEFIKIVKPNIGPFLFEDIAEYIIPKKFKLEDKLQIFKILCEKVNFKYDGTIYYFLESFCKEDFKKTGIFLRENIQLKNKLHYDCNSISERP